MQSAQLILTYTFDILFYGFSALFIFDFLVGLFELMQKQEVESFTTQTVQPQTADEEYSEASIIPLTNSDEATIQYLEMTGCDINDFESIAQARRFLDEYVPWTMEMETPPTQAVEQQSTLPIPDPWLESIADSPLVEAKLSPVTQKLTFKEVCIEFANQGLALERYRSGHYCYRIIFGCDYPYRFKTLQEAMDWLAVNKQSIQAVATN